MSRTLLLAGAAALALPLLSADPVREGHDLRPRFAEGQELTIRNEVLVNFGLDDATARMGEMEVIPEVPTVDVDVEAVSELSETIAAVRDGAITKMRRTHVEEAFNVTGEAGMQGMYEDIDESQEGPLQGRTFELTAGEEGWEVEDVSEDDQESLEDSVLAMVNERSHFEQLLPDGPVEVGATWNIGDAMLEEMQKALASASAEDADMAPMLDIIDTLKEDFEFDATGKLVSIDDDVAQIEWKVTGELVIDDLFGIIREVADPEMAGEIPEDAEGSLEFGFEMEGGGTFDLSSHQLTELSMEGEFALAGEFAMSQQGMEIEASAEASGTIEVSSSITVE